MRFRSLCIDYKAEALQILREEEEERIRNEHCNGDNNKENCTFTTKRVIRTLVDPHDEQAANDENHETGASSHSEARPMPSWLAEAISDSTDRATEKKTAVVTPESKSMKDDDGENKDDPMDIAESNGNHSNPVDTKKDNDCSKPMTRIDWSPWLLKFISAIRRGANRKRIANKTMLQPFYIQTNDSPSRFLTSFSRRILLRAMEYCWIQASWRVGWNRFKEISWMEWRKLPHGKVQKGHIDNDDSAFSSFICNQRGSFSSICASTHHTQHIPQSRALVVYRGDSCGSQRSPTSRNNTNLQQRLVLANPKESPTPKKIWETAILAAAALCAYQKQQDQKKDRCQKLRERKVTFLSPTKETKKHPDHDTNDTDKRNEGHSVNSDIDCSHRQDSESSLLQPLPSRGNKGVSDLKVDKSDSSMDTNKKKRLSSPSQPKQDQYESIWKKPRKIGEGRVELGRELNTEVFDHFHPSVLCNSIRSKKKKCSKRQLEHWKREAFFLSKRNDQRFGAKSNTKQRPNSVLPAGPAGEILENKNSCTGEHKISIVGTSILQKKQDDEESNDSERCLFGTIETDEDAAGKNPVDYSSPIEFPICNDYDDDEEDEPFIDNINDINTEFDARNIPDPFPTTHDKHSSPQSSNSTDSGTKNDDDNKNIAEVQVKEESGAFDAIPQSSNKKKHRTGKRRKRTELSRKREKKRRRASKKKRSKDESKKESFECENGNAIERDSDKLETPRKIEFREFSPVKDSKKYQSTKMQLNQSRQYIQSPNSVPIIRNDVFDSNDKDSELSPIKAKRIVPIAKDPFLISPDEVLETINRSNSRNHQHREASQHMKRGEGKAVDNDSICVLCSETFFENFGEMIAEITRENPPNRKSIRFIDTSLVDVCSVEIETPSRGAIVVSTISQIQNSGGIASSLLSRVIELAAINRYDRLSVFVCVDVKLDSALSRDIVRLQTSFLSCERGFPQTKISVQLCSQQSLGQRISTTILDSVALRHSNSTAKVVYWLADARACQRLKFLLSIIPSLSVTGALHWVEHCVGRSLPRTSQPNRDADRTAEWFQQCFYDVYKESSRMESRLLRSNDYSCMISTAVPRQLVISVKARF
eukprot:CAMPEP_0116153864 /NCGR_PEP_ID=MMETSP0329-20121206/21472_1 /TAXON_ID=697910 /ORGANISM="Pseudo-nitzschia arenysensis, Strain B593" /LENGTH=1101 /DNA_ID=CAMNT_0003650801 /DNA_START=749 /DNA_END=4051 /DNA_ORIENTATION=-